jgi:hypothetical protein
MILYIVRTRILVAVGAKLSASCWRRRIRLNNIDVDAVRSDSNRDRSSPPRPMDCYCIAIELRERSRWRGLISDLSSFRLEPSYCVLSGFAAIAGVVRCDPNVPVCRFDIRDGSCRLIEVDQKSRSVGGRPQIAAELRALAGTQRSEKGKS